MLLHAIIKVSRSRSREYEWITAPSPNSPSMTHLRKYQKGTKTRNRIPWIGLTRTRYESKFFEWTRAPTLFGKLQTKLSCRSSTIRLGSFDVMWKTLRNVRNIGTCKPASDISKGIGFVLYFTSYYFENRRFGTYSCGVWKEHKMLNNVLLIMMTSSHPRWVSVTVNYPISYKIIFIIKEDKNTYW